MRKDLEKRTDETDLEWLKRLHALVRDAGNLQDADREMVAILLNNMPALIEELAKLRGKVTRQGITRINDGV